jgi:hypothetical protein
MNVVSGRFKESIRIEGELGVPRLQHNTVIQGADSDTVTLPVSYSLVDTAAFCFRNNLAYNRGETSNAYGLFVSGSAVADATQCGLPPAAERNALERFTTRCLGEACGTVCPESGIGPLCDIPPPFFLDFSVTLPCVQSVGPLKDAGSFVADDMADGRDELFLGAAPEVGARESGTGRKFGGLYSWCPE